MEETTSIGKSARALKREAARKSRVVRAGTAIFGRRFQRPLGDALGLSQSAVAQILADRMPTSDKLHTKLKKVCISEAEKLNERSKALYALAIEITEDRDEPPSMKL